MIQPIHPYTGLPCLDTNTIIDISEFQRKALCDNFIFRCIVGTLLPDTPKIPSTNVPAGYPTLISPEELQHRNSLHYANAPVLC